MVYAGQQSWLIASKVPPLVGWLCLPDLAASPPAAWTLDRKREYLEWAAAVVAGGRGINPALDAEFDAAYAAAQRTFF